MTTSITTRHSLISFFLVIILSISTVFTSCKKDHDENPVSAYSSEVLDKWMTLQIRLMRNGTGVPNHAFSRHFAYAGVALTESLSPGLHWKLSSKWNGLTGLPVAGPSKNYYYPANVNATMAAITKAFFPNANAADKQAIDSLEQALNTSFLATQPESVITTSNNFGKAVATAVFNWAETDGYKNANNPYTPPTGPGLWVPTPQNFAPPATPYWGANRPVIKGSTENSQPAAPPVYSTDTQSEFYQMVKQVYDVSKTLTDDQKAMATFWRDVPGVTSPGHWISIVQQLLKQKNVALDKAAVAYALTGAAINDALISCFQTKYHFNLVRPVTYIREVMGITNWTPHLGTPAHPEYSSAHSSLSVAAAIVLQKLFGNIGSFTDHTYDYLGYAARTYPYLSAIGEEAAQSRLFAGIHYQKSIDAGIMQGRKVAENILRNYHVVPGYSNNGDKDHYQID